VKAGEDRRADIIQSRRLGDPVNLLLAAAILWTGGGRTRAREALLEDDPASVRFQADALDWRGLRLEQPTLSMLRSTFLHGFGSCSFREPMDELSAGGWR